MGQIWPTDSSYGPQAKKVFLTYFKILFKKKKEEEENMEYVTEIIFGLQSLYKIYYLALH